MPPVDSAALIVARFLKTNNYNSSFDAFVSEAGLPQSAGTTNKGDLTLETLLEEKKTFDVALRFEKLGVGGDGDESWSGSVPSTGQIVDSLPAKSNILSTTIANLNVKANREKDPAPFLITTTADRRLHILTLPELDLHASHPALSDAPILSCMAFNKDILLCTTMSGHLLALTTDGIELDKRKDHSKYVVGCAVFRPRHPRANSCAGYLVATAGWDNKVHIYDPSASHTGESPALHFNKPIASITLDTKPESLLFLHHPETDEPVLLLARTDSSFLFYYTIPSTATTESNLSTTVPKTLNLLGKQNLAPHSNAWVAFTPSSLALHPTDSTLLAVGTNSIPHMKVLTVRLLIPPLSPSASTTDSSYLSRPSLLDDPAAPPRETQASQARAALAVADREHAAIQIHVNTPAPQTAYSTPCVVWRPDGSGVWCNGDDGVVRGVEAKTGKVVAGLGEGEGGHEAGSKVRCLAVGRGEEVEVMVSGGFDQRLVVWRSR